MGDSLLAAEDPGKGEPAVFSNFSYFTSLVAQDVIDERSNVKVRYDPKF